MSRDAEDLIIASRPTHGSGPVKGLRQASIHTMESNYVCTPIYVSTYLPTVHKVPVEGF